MMVFKMSNMQHKPQQQHVINMQTETWIYMDFDSPVFFGLSISSISEQAQSL